MQTKDVIKWNILRKRTLCHDYRSERTIYRVQKISNFSHAANTGAIVSPAGEIKYEKRHVYNNRNDKTHTYVYV